MPLPEFLARRADLYRLRAADGDARRERDDRKTVLAIAQLAGSAANVYDRTLALYLAGSGDDPQRALALAQGEIAVRKDVYGYDALAWALLANDRPAEADDGDDHGPRVRDARREAALPRRDDRGRAGRSRRVPATSSVEALALDPSFDPLAATTARSTLARLR